VRSSLAAFIHANSFSTVSRSAPQTLHRHQGIFVEAVCIRRSTGSRLRIAKNVSVLWIDYATLQVVLPGVWEIISTSQHKIDKRNKTA
jgi:hypothetical protein